MSDTGIGLSAEELRTIFVEYGQVDVHRDINPNGTELGLPICRKLAVLMGGTLTSEAPSGWGSQFRLTLPPHAGGGRLAGQSSQCC